MTIGMRNDGGVYVDEAGVSRSIEVLRVVGRDGGDASGKRRYTLLTNQAAIGNGPQAANIAGGDYIWRVEATTWNGATATLQFLGLDGTTWYPVRNAANTADVALTASGSVAVGLSEGSTVRVAVTAAAPTGMNSALGGL